MLSPNTSDHNGTFFSQEKFIRAVVEAETTNFRTLKLQTGNSPTHLFGLASTHKFNTRRVWLAPFGLYAYPINGADGSRISDLITELKTFRTIAFYWSVRFDHGDLANQLERCGLDRREYTTQVVYLTGPYDAVFKGFSETTRNKIRKAERKGLVVRRATEPEDVSSYYEIYQQLRGTRGDWTENYTESLFSALVSLTDDVVFLLAELDKQPIAGGWFFRDGNSFMYWHGALDYRFKDYFPHYALLNHAIHLASEEGMSAFNMGASVGKESLEHFKSLWGSHKVPCWWFTWENPIWASIAKVRKRIPW